MEKRGSYARRGLETQKNAERDRTEDAEAHERWTARKVANGCDEFFKKREIKHENNSWNNERRPGQKHTTK